MTEEQIRIRRERSRAWYHAHKNDEGYKLRMRKYYAAHRDDLIHKNKIWKQKHPSRDKQPSGVRGKTQRKVTAKLPPFEKIAKIFKNPIAAGHYMWLMQNNGKTRKGKRGGT